MEVAEELEAIGPLVAVHGNNDSPTVCDRYPTEATIELEERTVVLIHGHRGGRTARAAARAVPQADIVLFGHSHMPGIWCDDGRLLFNPGSPTERRFAPYRSFGILDIGRDVEASIVRLA